MPNPIGSRISKWPFLFGDIALLAFAVFLVYQATPPLRMWEVIGCVVCVAGGATLAVIPFILEYRAAMRLAEAEGLVTATAQINNVERLAAQIGYATSQWQVVRESADKTASSAKEIAQGMASELKSFGEFMQRANESEKANLRLELEKMRRAESDWLQVLVRMLDHVFALHQGALRSRQPGVAEQIGNFQNACLDAARRVGLVPFTAARAEAFDEKRHQLIDDKLKPSPGATVEETVAAGYTFQGRLIRPALVRLHNDAANDESGGEAVEPDPASGTPQRQLFPG